MRKDLKIGLAIGMVLLALIVVVLLVPKNDPNGRHGNKQASSQTGTDAAHDGSTTTGGEGETTAPTEPPADGPADAPANKPERVPAKDQSDVFASGAERATPTGDESGTTPAAPKPGAGENGTDWANLLYAPLRTSTPTGEGAGSNAMTPAAPQSQRQATGRNDRAGVSFKANPTGQQEQHPSAARNNNNAAATTAASPRTHVVQQGETYSTIAKAAYGNSKYYLAIQQANPNLDPTHLKIGDVVNLPDRNEITKGESSHGNTEQPIDAATEYRVQSGDTLQKIAAKRYGTILKADDIYELNREKIGPDKHKLKLNMVLKMPAGGTSGNGGNARAEADADSNAGEAQTAGARSNAGQ